MIIVGNMHCFNVEEIVKYVKTLVDNNRCVGCDELKGIRVRYPCGHPFCYECVQAAENCLLCLSPPNQSIHVHDDPQSFRAKHTSDLLKTFQELFKLDVYRRQRVSDQLSRERELFPECIQAPLKYCNSKRNSNISTKNKENRKPSVFAGERTSRKSFLEMENKLSYVKQWLSKNQTSLTEYRDQNLPRKPFTDLNVNNQDVARPKTPNTIAKNKKFPKRNKSHLKILDSEDKSKLQLNIINKRKRKADGMKLKQNIVNHKKVKCEKNESGIFIDDDIEIISDTPSVDKDKEAWLSVLRAEKQKPCIDSISKLSKSDFEDDVNKNHMDGSIQCQNTLIAAGNVPFYRKSSLLPIKKLNKQSTLNNQIIQDPKKAHNMTFTIDSSSFITTIEFYENHIDNNISKYFVTRQSDNGNDKFSKHSVAVQTENGNDNFSTIAETKLSVNNSKVVAENNHTPSLSVCKNHDAESVNLSPVTAEGIAAMETNQNEAHQVGKEHTGVVIDDSDTDSEVLVTGGDSLIEVTAEVHRSETEYDRDALSQLEGGQYEHRMKRPARGHTPNSSDSSEKENYDPNRAKRLKLDKKCCPKKY